MQNPNDVSHLWELGISLQSKNVFQILSVAPSNILLFSEIKFWGASVNLADDVGFPVL